MELLVKIAAKVLQCLLKELQDPKWATSDYLTSGDGKFSWENTTENEHAACLDKMVTNAPAESPFAALTHQMQSFGRVLGTHASAIGQARMNGDFRRDLKDGSNDGAYHLLPPDMHQTLLQFVLSIALEICKRESAALN